MRIAPTGRGVASCVDYRWVAVFSLVPLESGANVYNDVSNTCRMNEHITY
jgi:hypothetical protein